MTTDSYTISINASDPTETLTLRDSFQSTLSRRWRNVRGQNRERLSNYATLQRSGLLLDHVDYLKSQIRSHVVEPMAAPRVQDGAHWSAPRVRTAYDKGLTTANKDLSAAGVSRQVRLDATNRHSQSHQSKLSIEYEKVYNTLRSHISVAVDEVETVLRDAIDSNHSVTWAVEKSNKAIRKTLPKRYNALANTATVRAVNRALLTSFKNAGVQSGTIAIEGDGEINENYQIRCNTADGAVITTAGDSNVCEQCSSVAGQTFDLIDIENDPSKNPPLHPNCRCRVVAHTGSVNV